MPRKKTDFKLKNKIKELTEEEGISSVLVSLWTNVNITTVSAWNSNTSQPSDINLDKVGELFEVDNRMLFREKERTKTGLAKALQKELDRLTEIEKMPLYVEETQSKTGKLVWVNNPELVRLLSEFAEKYK
jgi:predicted phosphohydrolase